MKIKFTLLSSILLLLLPLYSMASTWPQAAYEAGSKDKVLMKLYGTKQYQPHKSLHLKAPEIAENGAVVPFRLTTDLPDVESVSFLVDENPFPLAASFNLSNSGKTVVKARLKLRKSTKVTAIVKAKGKLYSISKNIKVTIGGCGGGGEATPGPAQAKVDLSTRGPLTKVSGKLKTRVKTENGRTVVRMLLHHPMHTGLVKNKISKKIIPPHFVKQIVGKHNGKVVFEANWGIAVSQNPFTSFTLDNTKKGDKIEIEWRDNKNQMETKKIVI